MIKTNSCFISFNVLHYQFVGQNLLSEKKWTNFDRIAVSTRIDFPTLWVRGESEGLTDLVEILNSIPLHADSMLPYNCTYSILGYGTEKKYENVTQNSDTNV